MLGELEVFLAQAISKHARPSKIYDMFWRCLADNGDDKAKCILVPLHPRDVNYATLQLSKRNEMGQLLAVTSL